MKSLLYWVLVLATATVVLSSPAHLGVGGSLLWGAILLCFTAGHLRRWLRPRRMHFGTSPVVLDTLGLLYTLGLLAVLVLLGGTLAFGWQVPMPWQVVSGTAADGTDIVEAVLMQNTVWRVITLLVCAVWVWLIAWVANSLLRRPLRSERVEQYVAQNAKVEQLIKAGRLDEARAELDRQQAVA
jgi:hypothetical protein